MNTVPLAHVCDIVMGQAPDGESYNLKGSGYPLIAGAGDFGDLAPNPSKYTTSPTKMSEEGDIIVCVRATIGNTNWSDKRYCLGRGVAGLRPMRDKLHPEFLWYVIQTSAAYLARHARGSTFLQVSKDALEGLPVPLLPLDEQRRIAAILDKADAIRRKRQQALALTDELIRATFLEMFGNRHSHKWVSRTIEWMAADHKGSIRTGPFGSQLLHSEFVDSGIAVLGIDNFVDNTFRWAKPRYITEEKYRDLKKYKVFPGDVVVTIMGTLGRCGVVPEGIPEAINTKHLCCISLNTRKCLPDFLHAAILFHPAIAQQLGKQAKGAIMLGLNMAIIKSLHIPMPSIALQEEFVRVCSRIRALQVNTGQVLQQEEDLFASCLHGGLSGAL